MFGRMDFREDGEKMRESDEIKLFEECWVGRGREENDNAAICFLSRPTKKFSLKWRELSRRI